MKALRLFIPGEFEDSFIYMGYLVALTTDRSLRFYRLERIVDSVAGEQSKAILIYWFLRNDWLVAEPLAVLLRDSTVSHAVWSRAAQIPSLLELESRSLVGAVENELDAGLADEIVLDMNIYNQRLYLAASSGFYHLDIEWGDLSEWNSGKPIRRHDARSMQSTAAYGAVNVSCGDEGLFTGFDEFDWSGLHANHGLRKTAERSQRCTWAARDLVNYATAVSPTLLASSHQRTKRKGSEKETQLLTDLGSKTTDLTAILTEARDREAETPESTVEFVFNSSGTLFAYTSEGALLVVGLKKGIDEQRSLGFVRSYETAVDEILSMHAWQSGMVIESADSVSVFRDGCVSVLHEEAVLTVRTYPRSRRYKNLITVTTETGITIISPVTPVDS